MLSPPFVYLSRRTRGICRVSSALALTLSPSILEVGCLPDTGGGGGDNNGGDVGDTSVDTSDSGVDVDASAVCGDGQIDGSEDCDGTEFGDATCEDRGFLGGDLTCTDTCEISTDSCEGVPGNCGDGELNTTEECEGFELRGETCESQGFYGGDLECLETCRLDTSGCMGTCGDGEVNGPESCDDGVNDGSYDGCESDCSSLAAYCGDREANGPEECDGSDLDGQSCLDLGLAGGDPDCTSSCSFDTSVCEQPYVQIGAGRFHSCARRTNGEVTCWGNDDWSKLTTPSGPFDQVSAGRNHICAWDASGNPTCWGIDSDGQASPPSGTFDLLAAGVDFTCGLRSNGQVECWGLNDSGETTAPSGAFIDIDAGESHACGIRADVSLECWGSDEYGQASVP